jgi:hypothetical protein
MRRSRYLSRSGLARRTAILLALALPATGWVVTGAAVPALACNSDVNADHCHAIAIDETSGANDGVFANIYSSCLYLSDANNFATQEIWDVSTDGNSWEEVGLNSGEGVLGGYYPAKTWFWADSRDGDYNAHQPNVAAAGTDIDYPVLITFDGNEQWSLWGGNDYVLLGASTSQSATLTTPEAGTEYTSAGGTDMRDAGQLNNLELIDTNGNYSTWADGQGFNEGPKNYIDGTYNPNSNIESWSWSC